MEWLISDIPAQSAGLLVFLAIAEKQTSFNELGMVLPTLTH